MTRPDVDGRPAGVYRAARSVVHAGDGSQLTDDECTSVRRLNTSDAQAAAEQCRGAFVVVVATSAGRYRRRVFLTLAASEHAAERARRAGHDAHVMLCRLDPVAVVAGQVVA